MPELPEVETIKRGLVELIIGKKIKTIVVLDSPKSLRASKNDLDAFVINHKIFNINRRGKALIIALDSDYAFLVHLRMTGQLVYREKDFNFGAGHPNDSLIGNLPDKTTRIIIEFTDDSKLFFNDQRKFGYFKLMSKDEVENDSFIKKLGPEPLDTNKFITEQFIKRIRKRNNSSVKAAILDQSVIAGIGNIYADEALFLAKIHPASKVKDLTDDELVSILESAIKVMKLSIELGGSTDKNYIDAKGNRGTYLNFANVFRREGQPCKNHPDVLIEKIRIAGRGTHICPAEQVIRGNDD